MPLKWRSKYKDHHRSVAITDRIQSIDQQRLRVTYAPLLLPFPSFTIAISNATPVEKALSDQPKE